MAKKKTKTTDAPKAGVFIYLGPSIRGVVQNATIYSGTKDEICKRLAGPISAFPAIERLIVPVAETATVQKQIKAGSNPYAHAYEKLLKS